MSISKWTISDLAEMTQLANDLDIMLSNQQYCWHCTVVPVKDTDMCDGCIADLIAWLEDAAVEATYQAQFHTA